jgi:dodecin
MSVAKFIELSGQSSQGYEDAIREAVARASSTIRNIQSVWAKEFEAVVENNQVTQFRVVVKIAFLLDEGADAGAGNLGEAQGLGLPRGEG